MTIALASCSKAPGPRGTPAPSAPVAPSTRGTSLASATPVATASPLPAATASTVAVPALVPSPPVVRIPQAGANAPPRILDVRLSATRWIEGDVVSGEVFTSSNVASVEARIATISINVPKSGVGTFRLAYRVPVIPFFFHGNYDVVLIARNTRGDRAIRKIPVTIQ